MENVLALRVLIQVAKTGSFSAAGRAMGLSAPSVFRYMNQLEDEIGAALVRRSSRNIALTEVGELVLARANAIVRDVDELKIRISVARHRSGPVLRIHTRVATGNELVVPVLSEFRRQHEEISLQLIIADRHVDLVDDNIDASITTDQTNDPGVVSQEITSCKYVLCASPAYLKKNGTPQAPADMHRHDSITFQHDQSEPRSRFRLRGIVQTVVPRSVVHTNNAGAQIALALNGAGLMITPHWLIANELRSGRLVRVLPRYEFATSLDGDFSRTVYALYRKTRVGDPRLKLFLNYLSAALRRRARRGWR